MKTRVGYQRWYDAAVVFVFTVEQAGTGCAKFGPVARPVCTHQLVEERTFRTADPSVMLNTGLINQSQNNYNYEVSKNNLDDIVQAQASSRLIPYCRTGLSSTVISNLIKNYYFASPRPHAVYTITISPGIKKHFISNNFSTAI